MDKIQIGKVKFLLERCESGRIGLTANELTWETGSEGSNPSLSARVTVMSQDIGDRCRETSQTSLGLTAWPDSPSSDRA